MAKNNDISTETQEEALRIAKKTQKTGQTKEQTRLIALGIQKGIAEYKKTAKNKLRQADKAKKKRQKNQQNMLPSEKTEQAESAKSNNALLPWGLLLISWIGFAGYILTQA